MKTSTVVIGLIAFGIGYILGSQKNRVRNLTDLSIEELNAKLQNLVKAEEYEQAAIIRDLIIRKSSV